MYVTTHILYERGTKDAEHVNRMRRFNCLEREAHLDLGRTWAILDHAVSEALKPHGITPAQYNVLRILRGAGDAGLCRNEVMSRMITKVPDVTRLLDRMEASGLVLRQRDSEDRRFVRTRLSEQGLKLVSELDDPVDALHRKHFGGCGEEELKAFIDTLFRIRETVQ